MATTAPSNNNTTAIQPRHVFTLPPDSGYLPVQILGEGAYGLVCSAVHRSSKTMVAIKRIQPFDHRVFCLRTLRELKILRFLRNAHPNIIKLVDVIIPTGFELLSDVLIVQQKMDTDLHRVIRLQTLSDDHCKYFAYQLLKGVEYLHSSNILHRDLKPSNIFVNSNCELKIGDFGLARVLSPTGHILSPSSTISLPRFENDDNKNIADGRKAGRDGNCGAEKHHVRHMTEYIATRWYRAPEIMLQTQEYYTSAIDMWSVGCIIGEMVAGRALFPGKSFLHQLALLTDYLGTPSPEDIQNVKMEKARLFLETLPPKMPISLSEILLQYRQSINYLGVDLMENLLKVQPEKRLSATMALNHSYLQQYRNSSPTAVQTPPMTPPPTLFDFDRNKDRLTRDELKIMIWREMIGVKSDLDCDTARKPSSVPLDAVLSTYGDQTVGYANSHL